MVEIIRKRNCKVPVLLTPDVKNAVEALISTQEDGNVSRAKEYVFAINDGKSMKSFRENDVIRQACSMVEIKTPSVITLTSLRKYVATVSQSVDMDQNGVASKTPRA